VHLISYLWLNSLRPLRRGSISLSYLGGDPELASTPPIPWSPFDNPAMRVYTHIMKTRGSHSEFLACQTCACSALRRASRAVTQHFERSFRGTGLRATQFSLLATLAQTGPTPLSALAAKIGVERTTLSRGLALLKNRGLIRMGSTRGDQRSHTIELTPAGQTAARKALPAWRRAQAGVTPILQRLNIKIA
jgi:DNA-binding MarR family transcriptional regulator